MKIQENISLKPYTTFGIDKKAKFFTRVSTLAELKSALIKHSKVDERPNINKLIV
jgi:UDP-N-acetylmuramate dehydrogenase